LDLIPQELDLGPVSFNKATVAPRKHAYVAKIPAEFPPEDEFDTSVNPPALKLQALGLWTNRLPALSYMTDSKAPEFMDIYTDPRPILYLRANVSAANNPNNIVYNSKVSGSFNAANHYDLAAIQPYLQKIVPNDDFHDPKDTTHSTSRTGFTGANLDPTKAWIINYFTAPGSTTARNAGSYLLIDAGPDRIFGTDDDIIVGAGGGQ
jgi:hypothetical protein